MPDLIFHHYPNSPFSEKVRLIFGFKQLAWQSVNIPVIMPKPDLTALTGGYRKTPVLQIGADIYCDTALIAEVLERIAPTPSLYPSAVTGLARTLAQWADSTFFWTAIAYAFQPAGLQEMFVNVPEEHLHAFAVDRSLLRGNAARLPAADATGQLRQYLRQLESMLEPGTPYLLGNAPCIADFSVYHAIWTIRRINAVAGILDVAPRLLAWADRMAAIGHHQCGRLRAGDALTIARDSTPVAIDATGAATFVDTHHIALGTQVTIAATDYGVDPVAGELVICSAQEFAVRRSDERAGTVVVHFPRLGFQLKKA
ncbi:MAG: glutathione S-transferase family protein [Glaciimonas sp.]|nr:glutathione S-transferase family protein [Glaciimonas sp.]